MLVRLSRGHKTKSVGTIGLVNGQKMIASYFDSRLKINLVIYKAKMARLLVA